MDEEKRFKHKLNMLEPGSRMLKRVNMLFVTAGRRVSIAIKAVSIVVAVSLLIGLTSCKPNLDSRVSVEKELSGLI